MRKRKVLIIILISAAVFICAKQIDSELKYDLNIADYYRYSSVTMGQISDIIDQGSLQVGVTHYPPLAFVNKYSNNNNIGMMADCLHFLGIELGCDIFSVTGSQEYISDLFKDDSLNAVMVEKNDFTAGEYDFTQPLFTSRGRIMVRSASGIESLDDLKGQALVAVKSDDVLDSVNRNEDFMEKVNIIEVDNMYQCFALIRKNVVSGFIGSDLEAAYFVRSISAESSYQFIGPDFYEKEICLGVKKGDAELLKALNKGILDMRQVISRDKVYHNPSDFKGQKIRIAQNDLNIKIWKAMGANPTPMAWGEVVTSLSQGQIDALDHSLGVFNDFNLTEIAPYVTITNHCSSPFPIICSREWIESLDKSDRDALEKCVKEVAAAQRSEEYKNEQGYLEKFKKNGATVYKLTDAEMAVFEKSCKPVYEYQRKLVGDEMVDKWLATRPK